MALNQQRHRSRICLLMSYTNIVPGLVQIAVMHAYIDMERFPDQSLDAALRMLLKGFRLPGGPA